MEEVSSSLGKKLIIGLGAVIGTTAVVIGTKLKSAYDYYSKNKTNYTIGDSAIEFKDNQANESFIQKLKDQNKLKANIIDNTNDKNYIRANSLTDFYNTEMKKEFICPITQNIMEEPVITPFGTTYEKSAIIDWIEKNKTDFQTKKDLTEDMLVPNYILKVEINKYKDSLNEIIE